MFSPFVFSFFGGKKRAFRPQKRKEKILISPPHCFVSFSLFLNPLSLSFSTLFPSLSHTSIKNNNAAGGLLEGFGRLLKFDLKVYVYPTVDPRTGELVTASDLQVDDPGVQKLYDYILGRGAIVPVEHYDRELLQHGDVSKLVAESIRSGTDEWEALVPHHVRDQVKRLNLLGYRGGGRDEDVEGGSGGSDGGEGRGSMGAGSRKVESGSGSGASKSKAKAAPAA
mgnify:CR=1 FL=1